MPLARVVSLNPGEIRSSVNGALDVVDHIAQHHAAVLARVTDIEQLRPALDEVHEQLAHVESRLAAFDRRLTILQQRRRPRLLRWLS
jgi:hypothetical protein